MFDRKEAMTPATKPGFFYGYIIVLAGFFITLISQGGRPVFSVFFKPVLTEFGWSRALTSGAFSLSMIVEGIMSIVMGGLNDKYGPRVVVTVCAFLMGIGYLLMAYIGASWQLYLLYGILVGAGLGGSVVPLLSGVVRWFTKRRSIMTAIVLTGSGLGQLIMPPVAERLISAFDWRMSYLILGGFTLLIIVIAAQFLKGRPESAGFSPYNGREPVKQVELYTEGISFVEAARTWKFWILFGILFVQGFTIWAITVHFAPFLTDQGSSPATAATILGSRGGAFIIGTIFFGSVADRMGLRRINLVGFAVIAASLFFLLICNQIWMFYLFFFLLGFGNGGIAATCSPLTAEFFGLRSHGIIFGAVGLGYTIGAAMGPLVAGFVYDTTLSYQLAFIVAAAVGVVGLILSVLMLRTKSEFARQISGTK